MGNACGNALCGPAADSLLAYQTLKVVNIKDHRLGGVYYGLILLIIIFVFGYEILYCNDQFEKRDVSGTPQVMISQPTMGGCNARDPDCESNFTSMEELPYCSEYAGGLEPKVSHARPCTFADRVSLLPNGVVGGYMMVPTRITTTHETQGCRPGKANGHTCRNEWVETDSEDHYVADIERYSLFISHTYHRDSLSGNNNRVLGYYLDCDLRGVGQREQNLKRLLYGDAACLGIVKRRPIECFDESCNFREAPRKELKRRKVRGGSGGGLAPDSGGKAVPYDYRTDGVYAVPNGDVFSVQKLMELAGVTSLDNATNGDGTPYREGGTVIDIEVRYSNLVPFESTFGHGEITYEYRVTAKPLHEVQDDLLRFWQPGSTTRTLERRHGVLFVVTVSGHFGFFSILNLMLMLAEAASMLAVATLLTDKIAIYMMERADVYFHSKYEETRLPPDAGEAEPAKA